MPGFSLHDELALLVESALTPLAALQAATLRPAEFLGRASELGSVAPGKRADLVLLSADPLADIHNTTQIQAVWLRGTYFDRAALGQLLAAAKHRHGKSKLDSPHAFSPGRRHAQNARSNPMIPLGFQESPIHSEMLHFLRS